MLGLTLFALLSYVALEVVSLLDRARPRQPL